MCNLSLCVSPDKSFLEIDIHFFLIGNISVIKCPHSVLDIMFFFFIDTHLFSVMGHIHLIQKKKENLLLCLLVSKSGILFLIQCVLSCGRQ
jgi:hypothetical protein